jgi:hypothetical protein
LDVLLPPAESLELEELAALDEVPSELEVLDEAASAPALELLEELLDEARLSFL